MGLLFGTRPFTFSDFFNLIIAGKLNLEKLSYSEVMIQSIHAGFRHIEITGDLPYVLPGILSKDEISTLLELKRKESLSYSIHLPLWGMEPAAFPPKVREGAIKTFIECIELTKVLEPICWVLHPTGPLNVEFLNLGLPEFASNLLMHQFVSWIESSIKELLDSTNIDPRKIAVENIEFPFEAVVPIIEKYDLGICLDTGHLLAGFSGKMSVLDFVDRFFEHLVELHLHDGKFPRIDHKPLGTLDLPVRELLLKLDDLSFKGPIVFELESLEQTKDSLEYIKKVVPEIF